MSEDSKGRKFNGWTNYVTWAMKLSLGNAEQCHRFWAHIARQHCGRKGGAKRLAREMKAAMTEHNEELHNSDLARASLSEVNWLEIAESYLGIREDDREPGKVRPLTEHLIGALRLDVWPSHAVCVDFGIKTTAHLGALQFAVTSDGVTAEELDEAMGSGEKLQRLVSPRNPYRQATFRTDWDELRELEVLLEEGEEADDGNPDSSEPHPAESNPDEN